MSILLKIFNPILYLQIVILTIKLCFYSVPECISYGHLKDANKFEDQIEFKESVRSFCWLFGAEKSFYDFIDLNDKKILLNETILSLKSSNSSIANYERSLIVYMALVIYLALAIKIIVSCLQTNKPPIKKFKKFLEGLTIGLILSIKVLTFGQYTILKATIRSTILNIFKILLTISIDLPFSYLHIPHLYLPFIHAYAYKYLNFSNINNLIIENLNTNTIIEYSTKIGWISLLNLISIGSFYTFFFLFDAPYLFIYLIKFCSKIHAYILKKTNKEFSC